MPERARPHGSARIRTRVRPTGRTTAALGVAALLAVLVWLGSFAGTDEPQAGVPVEEFLHIHGLAIPAWGDGTVYVSTHQGAFRIDDGDWSWISEQPHDFMGFAAHPTEDAVLFSSGHPAPGSNLANPVGFMVSSDGGVTWQPRSLEGEADFHAMAVGADGRTVYGFNVASEAGLYRSDDAGHGWQRLSAPGLARAGSVLSLAASPDDPGTVLAGTEGALLQSTDGGETWRSLLDTPVSAVAFDPGDGDRLVAYAPGETLGVIHSEDGGEIWEPLGLTLDEDVVGHIAVDPVDPDVLWLATWGEDLWRTTDGGRRWERLAENGMPAG